MEQVRKISDSLKDSLSAPPPQRFHKLSDDDEESQSTDYTFTIDDEDDTGSGLELTKMPTSPEDVNLSYSDDDDHDRDCSHDELALSGYCFNPRTERRRDQWIISLGLVAQIFLILIFNLLGLNSAPLHGFLFIYLCALIPFVWVWERLFRQPHFLYEEERTAILCGSMTVHNAVKFAYGAFIFYGFLSFTFSYFFSSTETRIWIVVSYTIFGSLLNLMTAVLLWDVITFLRFLRTTYRASRVTQPGRRLSFVRKEYLEETRVWYKWRAKAIWVTYLFLLTLALRNGYRVGENMYVDVHLENLPPCLDGYKIGMLSDVHSGPVIGISGVRKHVLALNADEPDLILLAGDMADGPSTQVGGGLEPIYNMERRPRDGIYYVTGNHEYLHGGDGDDWEMFWRGKGVTALHNEVVSIPPVGVRPLEGGCNATFDLAGTSDLSLGGADVGKAVEGLNKGVGVEEAKERLHVMVAHQPKQALEAGKFVRLERIHYMMSGHVHAGQTFPLQLLDFIGNEGLFTGTQVVNNTLLYVGEGTTGWGPRNRVFSSNERTIFTFYSKAESVDVEKLEMQEDRMPFVVGLKLAWVAVVLQFVACLGLVCSPPVRRFLGLCGVEGRGRSVNK